MNLMVSYLELTPDNCIYLSEQGFDEIDQPRKALLKDTSPSQGPSRMLDINSLAKATSSTHSSYHSTKGM